MQISSLEISNYRSIKYLKETPVNKFNIFVGQNNHGKTNLFEAVKWFYNAFDRGENVEDVRHTGTNTENIIVTLRFTDVINAVNAIQNPTFKTKVTKFLSLIGNPDTISIRRSTEYEGGKKRQWFNPTTDKWEDPGAGFDKALDDFLPKFEYVDTKKNFDEVSKYGKTTPVGVMLSSVLLTILETDSRYKELQDSFDALFKKADSKVCLELKKLEDTVKLYLKKQFPDCDNVEFEIGLPVFEDLLKNFQTEVDDGVKTNACDKGDGMQRALMLAIIQAYADFRKTQDAIGKNFLFFIDEAEVHLHPSAQRKLKNALLDLANNGDQVFINTHSSVLIADEGTTQQIFKVEKIDKKTHITPITTIEKSDIVYELLGGSPADLLLPKNFLIVEGETERTLLNQIITRHYPKKPKIQIICANGDVAKAKTSINAIVETFKPLGTSIYANRLIILIDAPNEKQTAYLDHFIKENSYLQTNKQLFILPCKTIEEYYPSDIKAEADRRLPSRTGASPKVITAQLMGELLSKENFEKMTVVHDALKSCWEKAFG